MNPDNVRYGATSGHFTYEKLVRREETLKEDAEQLLKRSDELNEFRKGIIAAAKNKEEYLRTMEEIKAIEEELLFAKESP